jgi:NADH-quinone oxidoreductase subunit A
MDPLSAILVLTVFVLIFGATLLFLISLVGPKKTLDPVKLMPYECGVPGREAKDSKISIKFYLTAILFILFDIEIIFMYPWAMAYGDFITHGHGLYVLIAMMVFIALFVFGLFWEVKSRALDWE